MPNRTVPITKAAINNHMNYANKYVIPMEDSELPAVTTEDNGDVLTVVNGAWDKAALPTGE